MIRTSAVLSLILAIVGHSAAADPPVSGPPASGAARSESAARPSSPNSAVPDRATLEKRFAERMTNVALVGHFTDTNKKASDLSEEKYIIEKAVKDQGDDWLLTVRIQYGKHNLPVTLRIPVLWAGDTPVLSVTKLTIPLLGTFNARVVIYEGHYAGMWSGAGHGGHLFGKIVKNPPAADKK